MNKFFFCLNWLAPGKKLILALWFFQEIAVWTTKGFCWLEQFKVIFFVPVIKGVLKQSQEGKEEK